MPARTTRRAAAFPIDAAFRALMDDAESGVLVLDPRRRVESVNPVALELLGVSPARARGAEASTLLRTVVAGEDLARDAFAAAHLEREAVLHTPGAGDVSASSRPASRTRSATRSPASAPAPRCCSSASSPATIARASCR